MVWTRQVTTKRQAGLETLPTSSGLLKLCDRGSVDVRFSQDLLATSTAIEAECLASGGPSLEDGGVRSAAPVDQKKSSGNRRAIRQVVVAARIAATVRARQRRE